MRQSTLPDYMEPNDLIEHMIIGENGTVTPWSFMVDRDRRIWIEPSCHFHNEIGGTSHIRIIRYSDHIAAVEDDFTKGSKGQGQHFPSTEGLLPGVEIFPVVLISEKEYFANGGEMKWPKNGPYRSLGDLFGRHNDD